MTKPMIVLHLGAWLPSLAIPALFIAKSAGPQQTTRRRRVVQIEARGLTRLARCAQSIYAKRELTPVSRENLFPRFGLGWSWCDRRERMPVELGELGGRGCSQCCGCWPWPRRCSASLPPGVWWQGCPRWTPGAEGPNLSNSSMRIALMGQSVVFMVPRLPALCVLSFNINPFLERLQQSTICLESVSRKSCWVMYLVQSVIFVCWFLDIPEVFVVHRPKDRSMYVSYVRLRGVDVLPRYCRAARSLDMPR